MVTASDIIEVHTQASRVYLDRTLAGYTRWIPDIAAYARLLNCLHDFYAPFEELMNSHMPALLPDYAQRKKAAWLVQDLTILGIRPVKEARPDMPAIQQPADAWGSFYMIESLTLEGAEMKEMIQSACPAIPETAFTFFSGYQQQTEAMWHTFITHFNEAMTTEEDRIASVNVADDCSKQFRINIQLHYSNHRC